MEDYPIESDIIERLKNKYKIYGDNTKEDTKTEKGATRPNLSEKSVKDVRIKDKQTTKNVGVASSSAATKSDTKLPNVVVLIDPDIVSKEGLNITNALEEVEIKHSIQPQIVPNSISWIREGNQSEETSELMLLVYWDEILKLVQTNSLTDHVRAIQEILPKKNIYLGIYGFENYFKFWKLKKTNPENAITKTVQRKYADYIDQARISKYELELALTEVQIVLGCCYRFLETPQDITNMILQCTKSITQAPQKLEHKEKYKDLEWYIPKDNRDCVQVDKNGNGLHRLWQQQLTMFELVRLETAEAIIAKYSTPASLFEAYQKCSESEGRKLLEDLPIRRAAGPITSSRKIGPELSNKMYNFFNAIKGDTII